MVLQLHQECLFYKLPCKKAFSAVPPWASGQGEVGAAQTGSTLTTFLQIISDAAPPPGSVLREKSPAPETKEELPVTHVPGGAADPGWPRAAEEGRLWAGLTIGPQISAGGMPGAGFGGPALCDKLLRRLTPRHVCMYAHRRPRVLPHGLRGTTHQV